MDNELVRIEQEIAYRTTLFVEERDRIVAAPPDYAAAMASMKSYADDMSQLQERYLRIQKINSLLEPEE